MQVRAYHVLWHAIVVGGSFRWSMERAQLFVGMESNSAVKSVMMAILSIMMGAPQHV